MNKRHTIGAWVQELPKRGRYTFTLDDVVAEFPEFSREHIHLELHRQAAKGKAQSMWRGFYAVVLDDYGLSGNVPPIEYIDHLMQFLGRDYYVALLSAASFHGSSHQAPQVFEVMVEGKAMRVSKKTGNGLKLYAKKRIPKKYLDSVMGRSGYINYSNKELTSLDLIARMKDVGGVSRAAEVIDGLVEEGLDYKKIGADFCSLGSIAHIQRLGYILDVVLRYSDVADNLFDKAMEAGVRFKQTLLVPSSSNKVALALPVDSKWKIAVNKEVELD